MTDQTEKAAARLSELAKRLLEFAMRLRTNSVRPARLTDKVTDGRSPLPAVTTGDQLT